jgi:hypothetical protein
MVDSSQADIDGFLAHPAAATTQYLDDQGRMTASREAAVELRCTKRGGPRGGVATIRIALDRARRLGLIRDLV